MTDTVQRIECFVVSIPRETPYLGPLALGERVNEKGYILRKGNRTLYPTQDRSILVKVSWRKSDTSMQRVKHDRPVGTAAILFHKKARELGRK